MTERWWPIGRINFSKPQMWWLISYLPLLQEGRWPGKPKDFVLIEKAPKKKPETPPDEPQPEKNKKVSNPNRVRQEPAQNQVLEIAAEVEIRLGMVINYISGWERPEKKIPKRRKK